MKISFPLFILALFILSAPLSAQPYKIITISGTGIGGYNGDGVAAASELNAPNGVAVDANGNVYVQDFLNYRIRKITPSGYITTIAGTGIPGNTGDGTIGTTAQIYPFGVAVDKSGNIYISDAGAGVIRKVNALGFISRVAGTGVQGYTGDNGPATSAALSTPFGMTFDTAGNLYFADAKANVVRKISTTGVITTVAGNDTAGYNGDNIPATDARLDSPYSVAVDRKGNLYVSDMMNNSIRKVDVTGVITTFAGTRAYGYVDNGPATIAEFRRTAGITVDTIGNLYIADADNDVIRKVDTFGMISTVAGNGFPGFGGDLGYPSGANLHTPFGIAIDKYGALFIADANNQRIRKVYNALAVEPVTLHTTIDVHPNPFVDDVVVSGLNKSDKVCVYDVLGKQVSAIWDVMKDGSQSFTIHDLAPGIYTLQVCDNNGIRKAITKLVKE